MHLKILLFKLSIKNNYTNNMSLRSAKLFHAPQFDDLIQSVLDIRIHVTLKEKT